MWTQPTKYFHLTRTAIGTVTSKCRSLHRNPLRTCWSCSVIVANKAFGDVIHRKLDKKHMELVKTIWNWQKTNKLVRKHEKSETRVNWPLRCVRHTREFYHGFKQRNLWGGKMGWLPGREGNPGEQGFRSSYIPAAEDNIQSSISSHHTKAYGG